MGTLRIAFFSSFILEEGATIIALEIGLRLFIAQMPFQTALFVLLLTPEFFLPLRLVSARYHAGMTGSITLQRIVEILEMAVPSQATLPTSPLSLQAPPVSVVASGIHLEHVSYTALVTRNRTSGSDSRVLSYSPESYLLMGPLLRRGLSSSSLCDESCQFQAADGSSLPPKRVSSDAACFLVERPLPWTDAVLLAPSAVRPRSSAC